MSATRDSGLVFVTDPEERPALELRVNFGVFAGRAVTPAEIDRLAAFLLDTVPAVTIVSEEHHEIGGGTESSVHLVRIEIGRERVPTDPDARRALEQRLVDQADYWARACIAERPNANTIN